MTPTLSVSNLLYEELVMLQDILIMVNDMDFTANLSSTEREIFEDLYEKIINS
jgi:hypothetical protein